MTEPEQPRLTGPVARPPGPGLFVRTLMMLPALVLAAIFVIVPLGLQTQAVVGGVVFATALLLNRFAGPHITLSLVAISVITSTRYMFWRFTATMDLYGGVTPSNVFAVVLFGAELYTFVVLLLGFLQSAWPLQRKPVPLPADPETWPTVDIYIPTYNEPLEVVRATVLAAQCLEWPADKVAIYVLDDGRRPAFRDFATHAGVGYIIRGNNNHAKAGNINHALTRTTGQYIAIFDCDHVPVRTFLQMCMGWMVRDQKIAMIQTPHHFYSPDPFERNLDHFQRVPNEGRLFYGLLQPGNDLWNATFFCGSCAVIRRDALLEVGGIAVETVTEDAHTALKLHRRGWKTAFLDAKQAAGLATESFSAHVGQRIRWARGMVQIFRTDNPMLGRGLSLAQRLCYTSAMMHFLFALPRIVFLVAPLFYLVFGLHVFNATPTLVLAYGLPHLAHAMLTNSRVQGRFRHSFWAEVYETALAFYILLPTTVAMVVPSMGKFNVTAKGGITEHDQFDLRIAVPFIVVLLLNLVGIGVGVYDLSIGTRDIDAVAVNCFWATYNVGILGATIAATWERRQQRRSHRVHVDLPVFLHVDATGKAYTCRTVDVGLGGLRVKGLSAPDLAIDDAVTIGVVVPGGEELPLPARVLEAKGDAMRLVFENLTLEEQQWIVRSVFGRADAWATWNEHNEKDRVWGSLAEIWTVSLQGIGRTLRWFLSGRKPARATG